MAVIPRLKDASHVRQLGLHSIKRRLRRGASAGPDDVWAPAGVDAVSTATAASVRDFVRRA